MKPHGWGDPEYFIKQTGPHKWEIAKFSENFAPDAVYIVNYEACTCPVGFDCKHVRLVKDWIDHGEVPYTIMWFNYDDSISHKKMEGML